MIILSHVKWFRHFDLSHDRLRKVSSLLFDEFLSNSKLLLIDTPDATAILCADVWSLSIHLSRIMHRKEPLKELAECDNLWVIGHFHSFCVPCFSIAYFFIVGIDKMSLLIATFGC